MPKKLLVAITGNIGSGKSAVGRILVDMGVPVVDTDWLANIALEQNSSEIFARYVELDGNLDKAFIQNKIINSAGEKAWLENLLYPSILQEMLDFLHSSDSLIVVALVPLLFEAGWEKYFDITINIACDDYIKIKRILERNKFSLQKAKQMLASQMPDALRIPKASHTLVNDSNISDLTNSTKKLFSSLSLLAT